MCGQMHWRSMALSVTLAAMAVSVGSGIASSQTCQELWVERNAYYNAVGYCFNTTRATIYFNKRACLVTSEAAVESLLPRSVRERISWIRDKERGVGCSTNHTRGPSLANATCSQLWVERNAYYKARGYCFQTSRAEAYFTKQGCNSDLDEEKVEANLSETVRDRIAEITSLESKYGCN